MLYEFILIFIFFCISNHLFYKLITSKFDLNIKQKAYLLSFRNAIIVSIIGIIVNYLYFSGNKKSIDLNFSIISILFFTSYLLSDLLIGNFEYKSEMGLLSTYSHHIFYIIFNFWIIYKIYNKKLDFEMLRIYMLFLVLEIPTLVFSFSKIFPQFKQSICDNNVYTIIFFLFRVLYHLFLLKKFWKHNIVKIIGIPTLLLHIYWVVKSFK